jgi:hypothetical protein
MKKMMFLVCLMESASILAEERIHLDWQGRLAPFFHEAGVQFPPQQLALLVFKKNQRLDLWAKDAKHDQWVPIRSFEV